MRRRGSDALARGRAPCRHPMVGATHVDRWAPRCAGAACRAPGGGTGVGLPFTKVNPVSCGHTEPSDILACRASRDSTGSGVQIELRDLERVSVGFQDFKELECAANTRCTPSIGATVTVAPAAEHSWSAAHRPRRFAAHARMQPTIPLPGGGALPRVGLGTFRAGGAELRSAVHAALGCGIRHIDTAAIYKVRARSRCCRDAGYEIQLQAQLFRGA